MSINRTLLFVFVASLAVVGCSKDKDKERTRLVNVGVMAGQQDISNALVRSSEVLVSGLPDESNEGLLNYQSFYTQNNGAATVAIYPSKLQLFELVTLQENKDINQIASVSRCQWVKGCNEGAKQFGENISPTYQWQSVAWDLRKDEQITVTPLTHLAAALAFEYAYAETPEPEPVKPGVPIDPLWQKTGYYSPYSVEQAVSQVSRLFGISNVQTTFPADLTRINSLNSKDPISAKNSIRYGAILAAWAHLQETNAEFTEKATNEFLDNNAQIMQKQKDAAGSQVSVLTLKTIYSLAKENLENLEKLPVNNAGIKSLITDVVNEFDSDLTKINAKLNADLTDTSPASIKDLFGDTAFNDYKLGVERTKLFVEDLVDGATKLIDSKYFFGKEYHTALRGYIDQQKQFFKTNKASLNKITAQLNEAQQLYVDSYLAKANSCASYTYTWIKNCDYSANVMSLTDKKDKKITLQMQNVADNAQAVDIEINGELQEGDLIFKLKDSDTRKSRVRLFYAQAVNEIQSKDEEPIGYEHLWADFTLFNAQQKTTEFTGNFSLLYRGVKNPEGSSAKQHFNIDTVRLSSRLSDEIEDEGKKDKDIASVFIAAQSSTAGSFYNANEKFGKFNGFFTEQTVGVDNLKIDLVSYALGQETISDQNVEFFDFRVQGGESFRYRFYPEVERKRMMAGQTNASKTETFLTYNMAVCPIKKIDNNWKVSAACSPTQAFNGKRDVQKSINALWQAGAFSYVNLPGNGEYFVEWPATKKNGCYELDALKQNESPAFAGELISPAVLGLDTLRVTTEIILSKKPEQKEFYPKTLLDVLIKAPTKERYNVTAALSHNYSTTRLDEVNVGENNGQLDLITVNYNTDSNFKRMGNLRVYKSGVKLGEDRVNAELMAGLNQSYQGLPHKYVTASNGGQKICVIRNEAEALKDIAVDKEKSVYSLSFRGVTYGSIRNEKGTWVARFVDGTWIPLVPN